MNTLLRSLYDCPDYRHIAQERARLGGDFIATI